MQDNSTDDITEMLIRYMDKELSSDEIPAVEKLLQEDADTNERYQLLLAAKQAIRSQGLKRRVSNLQNEYLQNNASIKQGKTKLIRLSFTKTITRIAAVFILAIAGYGIYEYNTTSYESVFNNNFSNYDLPVNRSANTITSIDSLYNLAKYSAVIAALQTKPQKDQQDYFIEAQSYLHLNNTEKAIEDFKAVQNLNENSTEKYFEDETDYYLALAYIKSGNVEEGKNELNKIMSDKTHLYYNQAKKISGLKLEILKWKAK